MPALPPLKKFATRDVFLCGAAFELAGYAITSENNDATQEIASGKRKPPSLPLVAPMIVNFSFALELYFKCIIWDERGSTARQILDHKLLSLFQKISPAKQQRISNLFDQLTDQLPLWVKTRKEHPEALSAYRIPKVLELGSNSFAEHRYYFEGIKTAHESTFTPALPATREAILEMHADWREFALQLPGIPATSPVR